MVYKEMIDIDKEESRAAHRAWFEEHGIQLILEYIRNFLFEEDPKKYMEQYIKYQNLLDEKHENREKEVHALMQKKFGDKNFLSYHVDFDALKLECEYEEKAD